MKKPAPAKPAKTVEKSQRERFIETAGALGCDDDENAFEEKLRRVAKHRPQPKKG